MSLHLKNKVALVTGASKGLGYATAHRLAAEGCIVVIAARNKEALISAAHTIKEETENPAIIPYATDVANKEELEKLSSFIDKEYGGVDIVVANAGGPKPGKFENIPDEWWYQAIDTNLMSTIRLFRNGLQLMKKKGAGGRLIVITTTGAKVPQANLLISNTLRAGIHALVKTLSKEIAALNITVNAVVPGKFWTDRQRSIVNNIAKKENLTTEATIAKRLSEVPMNRMGEPKELANYIAFLCSSQADYITGTALNIDGGFLATI